MTLKKPKKRFVRRHSRATRTKVLRKDRRIGFAQARRSFEALLDFVRRGYSFTILRRGRAIAQLRQS
jgi:tRNA pseudouridine-54 N-methylase